MDLIYALEGQSADSWLVQLEEAVRRKVDHLSCYQLTFHSRTIFGRRLDRGELFEMTGDAQSELFLLTHLALADFGYEGYEVSNFAASPDHQSAHNIKYWTHSPILDSAHRPIPLTGGDDGGIAGRFACGSGSWTRRLPEAGGVIFRGPISASKL